MPTKATIQGFIKTLLIPLRVSDITDNDQGTCSLLRIHKTGLLKKKIVNGNFIFLNLLRMQASQSVIMAHLNKFKFN